MIYNSAELSNRSTELQFAVYGVHGVNKKGELVPLDVNDQKGIISKIGTSISWHLGQIDRSQDAIDAYNEKIKSAKHIKIDVKVENDENIIIAERDNLSSNNNNCSKIDDRKLIDELEDAETKLHDAEKELKDALKLIQKENEHLKSQLSNHSAEIKTLKTNYEQYIINLTNEHSKKEAEITKIFEIKINQLKEEHSKNIADFEIQFNLSKEKELHHLSESYKECIKNLEIDYTAKTEAFNKHHADSINSLKKEHSRNMADLKKEATASKKSDLKALRQVHEEHVNKLTCHLQEARAEAEAAKQALAKAQEKNDDYSELVNKFSIVEKAQQVAIEQLEKKNQDYEHLRVLHDKLNEEHSNLISHNAKIILEVDLMKKSLDTELIKFNDLHEEHATVIEKLHQAEQTIEKHKNELEIALSNEIQKVESTFKAAEDRLKADLTKASKKVKSAEKKAEDYAEKFKRILSGESAHALTVAENLLTKLNLHESDHGKKVYEEIQAKKLDIDLSINVKESGNRKKKKVHIEVEKKV